MLEKFPDIVMDSSTYGVPTDSAEGYKLKVQDAVRIDNPALRAQRAVVGGLAGRENVSHGCINLSPANAQWFYDNFGSGDPIVIKNSAGRTTSPTARLTGRCSNGSTQTFARHCGGGFVFRVR